MSFALFPNQSGSDVVILEPGDIYAVLEFIDAESEAADDEHRSTILHPDHGPCKTFVCLDRGQILGSNE